jgi:hypothetical protein
MPMSTGAEECYQQSEAVLCPLCRHPWISEAVRAQSHVRSKGTVDCKQRVSTDHHHRSPFQTVNSGDPPHIVHNFSAVITPQLKKSHDRDVESELSCTHSPVAVSPLASFGSGSSGYKSLSSDSSQVLQEVLTYAGVIPAEQLLVANEWAKV